MADYSDRYRVVHGTEIPLVMKTGSGKVHVVSKGSRHTLCRKPFSGNFRSRHGTYGQKGLRKTKFRPLGIDDKDHLCTMCYDRLDKSGFSFPWSLATQTLNRLEGMGLESAKTHGEDRVSLTVEEMDTLISMIRRG